MSVQITIIGLGQIGASVGLALGRHESVLHRVGYDLNRAVAREAQKKGAIDAVGHNLRAAVREAQIILLSLPINEIRETLAAIAEDLLEGAIIMDTAPVKEPVAAWAKELLPKGCYYIGLALAINPLHLHRIDMGVEAAVDNLFQDGVVMLDALPGTPEEAVKLGTDFITLLGATPVFADLLETDGMMSSTHLVPQLMAAALLNAVVDQPGWRDARKLAGRPFAALTSALAYQDEITALGEAALLSKENVARVLDVVIGSLQGLRDDIAAGNREEVAERLELALDDRRRWLAERLQANWLEGEKVDLSKIPSFWERFLGTRGRPGV